MKAYLINLCLSFAALLLPIKAALLTVFALVIADLILGLAVALKNKEPITSKALRTTVSKILAYEFAIIFAYLAEQHLIGDSIPVMKIVSGLIGVAELRSLLENSDALAGGNLFKTILEKLKG